MKKSELEFFRQFIGHKVYKPSWKPFKSGLKTNTVKRVVSHEKLGSAAFIFDEDDSYVSVYSCRFAL